MNASPVLLLLILLSTCCGDKQIDSNATRTSAPRNRQETATPMATLCPDPTDIKPCECRTDEERLIMDCRDIEDEEQLWQVFSAYFPTTAFYAFVIRDNYGLKVLENGVFRNVSFRLVDIKDSALEIVEHEALNPSLSTLTTIDIEADQLATFPFERLPEFTSLEYLLLYINNISSIPPLSSSTLQQLGLAFNLISSLPPDAFKGLRTIQKIDIFGCQLTEITPGAFKDLPQLWDLNLQFNNIGYIQSLTFNLGSSPLNISYLALVGNNIDFVEEDAFRDLPEPSHIHMEDNALTRLPERVWRPVLEREIVVFFEGNPLACGCDVAWIVSNPQLFTKIWLAQCSDGRYLVDLDPADFSMCG